MVLLILYPRREGSKGKFLNSLIVAEQSHVACLILVKRSAVTTVCIFYCSYKEHCKSCHWKDFISLLCLSEEVFVFLLV